MSRLRVLVVEDSTTVRKHIVEALASRPDFEVVGEASDGKQGIELCMSLRPDVITLDMMMPELSGLAATEYIMAYCPTPILIVSSSTNRGELFKTYEALAAGALDVLDKPLGAESDEVWEERLASTLRLIARIKVITHPRARLSGYAPGAQAGSGVATVPPVAAPGGGLRAIVMGASTGGPGAVLSILKGLPSDFPLPILLVVHLGRVFGSAFPEWMDGVSSLRVGFAQHGEALPPPGQGRVFLAPPDMHLAVKGSRLWLDDSPPRHSCKPAVDVLFESAARELGPAAAGCLLTGMGKDGALGLLGLRQAGAMTLAQENGRAHV